MYLVISCLVTCISAAILSGLLQINYCAVPSHLKLVTAERRGGKQAAHKSFSQVFHFVQGCQLVKLQACVPRLLKDKALPCGLTQFLNKLICYRFATERN